MKILIHIRNAYKYYIIRKELIKRFKADGISNNKYRKQLTKNIYKSSKIVKNNIDETKKRIDDYNNNQLSDEVTKLINKHFREKENELKKREVKVARLNEKIKKKKKDV